MKMIELIHSFDKRKKYILYSNKNYVCYAFIRYLWFFFSICKFVLNINKQFLAFVKFTLGLILKYSCKYLECKQKI